MTKVLVVDDSATMRRVMRVILESAPGIEPHFAKSGEEALSMIPQLKPDVVTLDIIMTGMDGLEALQLIMDRHPIPVVMVSSLTSQGAVSSLDALNLGAVDILPKPTGTLGSDLEPFRSEVLAKISVASKAAVRPAVQTPTPSAAAEIAPVSGFVPMYFPIVLIGSSTGGPPALEQILSRLSPDFPAAIVIAQHMPAGFTATLADRLNRSMSIPVDEVTSRMRILPGRAYIAQGDADIVFEKQADNIFAKPVESDPVNRWHPSVDRMAQSAGETIDSFRLIGVMLTGMGNDGAASFSDLLRKGARTIAESEDSAVVWGMPGALVQAGAAQKVLPADQISGALWTLTR